MRIGLILATVFLLLPAIAATQTGYCTGQYVETGPDYVEGLIQAGDVFEYWCELPSEVGEDELIDVELRYSNAQLVTTLLTPRTIYGTTVVIFP